MLLSHILSYQAFLLRNISESLTSLSSIAMILHTGLSSLRAYPLFFLPARELLRFLENTVCICFIVFNVTIYLLTGMCRKRHIPLPLS